jgi:hypothetical protein
MEENWLVKRTEAALERRLRKSDILCRFSRRFESGSES